jgi:group I intron endonuclease
MIRNEIRNNKGQFKKGSIEYMRGRNNVPLICGIYKITNPNHEVYIGSSRTIYRRWLRHREARKNVPLHISIKKYGWQLHKWEILSELPNDINEIDLINQEQVFIDAYSDCGFKILNVKQAGHYLKKNK